MPSERADGKRTEPGTFVISLDFELHWGLRDIEGAEGPYRRNLLGVREAIPAMLASFERHRIHATWATVGFLFAGDRNELRATSPALRPTYRDPRFFPYEEAIGDDESTDPVHFGKSLVDRIAKTAGQEVGSHSFSHFYCLEEGQTEAQFEADVRAARDVAAARGIALRSFVFPRNQVNPAYSRVLRELGFTSFRGSATAWPYTPGTTAHEPRVRRVARLADTYLPLTQERLYDLREACSAEGLWNFRASHFLRPARGAVADRLQIARITRDLERAAEHSAVFHLWWHPHNFGVNLRENIALLESILRVADRLVARGTLRSLTMGELADVASRGLATTGERAA